MNIKRMLADESAKPYLLKARYGIEKESQRVDLSGNLTKTNHPESISIREDHPYIQRDFAETQLELITPVADTIEELFNYLEAIHDVTYSAIGKDEMLWPLSMPPKLPAREEDIIIAKFQNAGALGYRNSLAETYGRRKQMISGIHYNFEFGEELIETLFELQSDIEDYTRFKTEIYMKVTRNYLHYRWLITYFYGASPLSEGNFFEEESLDKPVRSIRSSSHGYKNHDDVKVSYVSLNKYISDISKMVEEGLLVEEKEFYSAVRLRGGYNVADLESHGIRYIELRNIDLNPFDKNGISREQSEFLHLFLFYLLCKDEEINCDEWIEQGEIYNNKVALEHPLDYTQFKNEAEDIVCEMESLVKELGLNISDDLFSNLKEMLKNPSKTLAGKLYKESQKESQSKVSTSLAKKYYYKSWEKPYQLTGFTDMELSTQLLIFDAIEKGIKVEVLDREDQFLKLKYKDHVEYVKNGNMTSKDTYISTLIMENKVVTKKILKENGFLVPLGEEFHDIEEALSSYKIFSDKAFVIKPKSTNYGLGISIFKEGSDYEDYKRAITLAFKEDDSVIIEEFVEGVEYRFFVLDDKVLAVLLRVPANVVGDGKHTIRELVDEKNEDPLRGLDHRTPLEKIELGESEKLVLKSSGYDFDSIAENGEVVYLRENSNISTGGDSVDVTDQMHEDYKKIAADAVAAIGAKISGIDLIIKDKNLPANNKDSYGIIEANFNPLMYMHIYPYKGKSHRLSMDVINYLFPELK